MPELQFESLSAERLPQNLVAEANPEDRNTRFDEVMDRLNRVAESGGIAWTIGKEDAGGLVLERFRRRSGRTAGRRPR